MKLKFGKYKDKTIAWVKKNDTNYYEWGCINIPDIFVTKPKVKKIKEVVLSEEIVDVNCNFNYDFKWHESYPEDMTDRMYKWFRKR